jgi:hypothetical protein
LLIESLYATMSSMKLTRQTGAMNLLVIPLVLLVVVLLGVAVFAFSAYGQAQDYKNNVDQKVAAGVSQATDQINAQKEKEYAEKEKYPYATYVGPEAAGSIKVLYPKTWSAYVVVPRNTGTKPLDGYFYPGQVPSVTDTTNSFALRVVVQQTSYDNIMRSLQSQQKAGKVSIQPYQSPNIPSLIGSRVDGQVVANKQGSMIVLPFRDKTLQMWTESTDYKADFDNIILKNFTLTP